jgi:hypothetical protein
MIVLPRVRVEKMGQVDTSASSSGEGVTQRRQDAKKPAVRA